MNNDNESRIEKLAQEKMAGKSYSLIREELAASGMSDAEIKQLIRQVDELVLSETLKQGDRDRARQWYRFGLVLAAAGLVLSIVYNAGIILVRFPAMLVYTPFFAGILLMLYGRFLQKKQSPALDAGTGAIRRKRPYK